MASGQRDSTAAKPEPEPETKATAAAANHDGNENIHGGATSADSSSTSDFDATTLAQLERKISQAADEGHDADIPSNAGYVLDERGERRRRQSMAERRKSLRKSVASEPEPDLEKGAGGGGAGGSGGEKDEVGVEDDDDDQSSNTEDSANVVWWDGPDDPENPYNWPTWRKALSIGLVSAMTFISPLASCKSLHQVHTLPLAPLSLVSTGWANRSPLVTQPSSPPAYRK